VLLLFEVRGMGGRKPERGAWTGAVAEERLAAFGQTWARVAVARKRLKRGEESGMVAGTLGRGHTAEMPPRSWPFRLGIVETAGLASVAALVVFGASEAIVLVPALVAGGTLYGCTASGQGRPILLGLLAGLATTLVLYGALLALALSSSPVLLDNG
jgi:hypothetical protein